MKILVAATIPSYIAQYTNRELWGSWLKNRQDADYFAALETDGRGIAPFETLLQEVPNYWTFSITDNATEITSDNRIIRICTGRNLISHYAMVNNYSHVLFIDADVSIPPDGLEAMLDVDWPIVGLNIPTYCLDGDRAYRYPNMDVREHWNSAGCLLVERQLFTRVKWRVDSDKGMTDDPCYGNDCKALGFPTYVRHDIEAKHYPESIGPLEQRGYDRSIR